MEYVAIQPDENFNFTIEPDENINDFSQSDDASTVAARQKNCANFLVIFYMTCKHF
jgi:hypothetical protein